MHFKNKSFLGISLSSHNNSNLSIHNNNINDHNDNNDNKESSKQRKQISVSTKSSNSTGSEDELDKDHHHNNNHNHNNNYYHSHMNELRRFFKHKKPSSNNKSELSTPSQSTTSLKLKDPFHEASDLVKKYGQLGKVLGSGAGGSVRLLTRPSDGLTFAVKEFRAKRSNEQLKDYVKKCTAEFCVGSTLDHQNIIKTLDITNYNDHYFEIMEYCPVDFFAVVMSGQMVRNEINCCFKQLVNGVNYIHSMGLAHRDLKLDNCVMTKDGICKIIDFGSAVVFKYPYDNHIVKTKGIMGSDPYLAPEVLKIDEYYDPQLVDIWSLAIIYCCIQIKRFPWKCPKITDSSYKLFQMPDDQPHDYTKAAKIHAELIQKRKDERKKLKESLQNLTLDKEKNNNNLNEDQPQSLLESSVSIDKKELVERPHHIQTQRKPSFQSSSQNHFHGPYRLLRLLPHAARPIISKMLAINPEDRATIRDILDDDWFKNIQVCTLDEGGNFHGSRNHLHIKIKEDEAHLEFYKSNKQF
ncbi:hypothetical protein WICMUC_001410 [Wickerhamomyces mucosus]|uniref:non-specific serine/threonine protein kinase n=1 Tax=Wickerhamomyces mucosus TaxID=1378264 RepID=A0A9P8TG68_9ASCO|nr:hypothetical protein WICMUC_001410 [Wickerhamomyces mucosus]